jgi:hypothetical protein
MEDHSEQETCVAVGGPAMAGAGGCGILAGGGRGMFGLDINCFRYFLADPAEYVKVFFFFF